MGIGKGQLNRAGARARKAEAVVRKTEAIARDLNLMDDTMIIRHQPLPRELALLQAGFVPKRLTWLGPVAPPAAWQEQHVVLVQRDRIISGDQLTPVNRPVPRQASCHYVNSDLTASISSTYFY